MITRRTSLARGLVVAALAVLLALTMPATGANIPAFDLYKAPNGTLVLNSDLLLGGQGLLSELFAQVRANTAAIAQLQRGAGHTSTVLDSVLQQLPSMTRLSVSGSGLSDLSFLRDRLTSITGGSLTVDGNANLTSLSGLSSLTTISSSLSLVNNPALTSISALSSLTLVGGLLEIRGNANLISLAGLSNVKVAPLGCLIQGNVRLPTNEVDAFKQRIVCGTQFFLIGGMNNTARATSSLERYDSLANTWTYASPMPAERSSFATASLDGYVFAIGGYPSALTVNERYDPRTDTWARKAPMPTGRYDTCAAAAGGLIYVTGGNGPLATVERYSPSNDMWATVASMLIARANHGCASANGVVFVFGGDIGLSSVEKYNPAFNSWTVISSMPGGFRSSFATISQGGFVYLIGGFNSSALSRIERYNPSDNTWVTTLPAMPAARSDLSGVALQDVLYLVGGEASGRQSLVEKYNVTSQIWGTVSSLGTARNSHACVKIE